MPYGGRGGRAIRAAARAVSGASDVEGVGGAGDADAGAPSAVVRSRVGGGDMDVVDAGDERPGER